MKDIRMSKILATAGPASSSSEVLQGLLDAGVDAFRLNFSHGTAKEHIEILGRIRTLSKAMGRNVAILQDLAGPKIRVGEMLKGGAALLPGSEVTIVTRPLVGTSTLFSTSYRNLPRDVQKGHAILLDDGLLALEVTQVTENAVQCRVVKGGVLRSRKGMNLPGTRIQAPALTRTDLKHLEVGLSAGVDYVALSFVRSADDLLKAKRAISRHGSRAWVIAKIERPEAVERMDEIIDASDGIMVARGDLGVEMAVERVPLLQKELIRRANQADKLVITATQMLESMVLNPTPTRAEVSDIANAIMDGTDVVMLSAETSVGKHPVRTVEFMDRIIRETESFLGRNGSFPVWDRINPGNPVLDSLGHATRRICTDLRAAVICNQSKTGRTALFLSKSRPFIPIVTFSEHEETVRRLALFWGTIPVFRKRVSGRDKLMRLAVEFATQEDLAGKGDTLVIVTGQPEKPNFVGAIDVLQLN